MKTLTNNGRGIDSYRCSNGLVVTIDDNQARDLPDECADEMLREFPHLTCVFISNEPMVISEIGIKEGTILTPVTPVEEKKDPFIEEMTKGQVHVCSVCGNKFDTNRGMRTHLRLVHESK